jgi:hypothetical protein
MHSYSSFQYIDIISEHFYLCGVYYYCFQAGPVAFSFPEINKNEIVLTKLDSDLTTIYTEPELIVPESNLYPNPSTSTMYLIIDTTSQSLINLSIYKSLYG